MKVGDLVKWAHNSLNDEDLLPGIIVSIQDDLVVPPVVLVMWHSGEITKEWLDEVKPLLEREDKTHVRTGKSSI